MADVSLSRAIADESLGKRIGRGLKTTNDVLGTVAPFSNPISALPQLGQTAVNAGAGFFSDIAAGFTGDKGPDSPYDAGENLVENPNLPVPAAAPKEITNQSMGLGDQIGAFLDKSKLSPVPIGPDPITEFNRVTPPQLAPPPSAQGLKIAHTYGTQTKGGVFGAFANNVNKAADTYDQLAERKAGQRDFSNSVTAATANAGNFDKLYDSGSKRYGVRAAAEAHGLTAGVAALKNLKEVQEAELLRRRNNYLAQLEAARGKGGSQLGFEDLATLTNAHLNPDQITTLPASVGADGKPLPPMAISSRYGSAITPGAQGAMVDQVHSATNAALEGKIMMEGKTRYVIKNGQKVPF